MDYITIQNILASKETVSDRANISLHKKKKKEKKQS